MTDNNLTPEAIAIPLFLRLKNVCGHDDVKETCLMCEAAMQLAELEGKIDYWRGKAKASILKSPPTDARITTDEVSKRVSDAMLDYSAWDKSTGKAVLDFLESQGRHIAELERQVASLKARAIEANERTRAAEAALNNAERASPPTDARYIDRLERICSAAYQLAGVVGAPERFLNALALHDDADIDNLLPISIQECDEFRPSPPPEARLTEFHATPEKMEATFEGELPLMFANAFVDWFDKSGGENFVTVSLTHKETGRRFSITMQREGGKTPAERIAELQKQSGETVKTHKSGCPVGSTDPTDCICAHLPDETDAVKPCVCWDHCMKSELPYLNCRGTPLKQRSETDGGQQ